LTYFSLPWIALFHSIEPAGNFQTKRSAHSQFMRMHTFYYKCFSFARGAILSPIIQKSECQSVYGKPCHQHYPLTQKDREKGVTPASAVFIIHVLFISDQ